MSKSQYPINDSNPKRQIVLVIGAWTLVIPRSGVGHWGLPVRRSFSGGGGIGHSARSARGFTLIEVLVYIGLFTLIVTLVTFFLLGLFRSFIALRAERSAVLNAALAMQAAGLELRHADRVYTSTSVFDNDAGQLSVRTPRSSPTDHDFAYTDFYLDNGVIYERRDGASPTALTSGDVTVSVFRVERYTSSGAEGVRFTVTATPANVAMPLAAPRTLRTFVSLRGFTP